MGANSVVSSDTTRVAKHKYRNPNGVNLIAAIFRRRINSGIIWVPSKDESWHRSTLKSRDGK